MIITIMGMIIHIMITTMSTAATITIITTVITTMVITTMVITTIITMVIITTTRPPVPGWSIAAPIPPGRVSRA